jgi:prepilin-type N-terminal cleavage/methylation domain-containing protein
MTVLPRRRPADSRVGFTLIEILVVLLVMGILAGLAYARLQSSKDKAVVAGMTSDLHAIAEEQEAYYIQKRFYSPTIDSLNANPSPGNVIVIVDGTASGWSGSVSNPNVVKQCYIFVGTAAPIGSATNDGVINCS